MRTDCPLKDCQASKSVDEEGYCACCARVVKRGTAGPDSSPKPAAPVRAVT